MKTKHTTLFELVQNLIKKLERAKVDNPSTHKTDRSHSWLGTGTSIKNYERKSLVLWAQIHEMRNNTAGQAICESCHFIHM